MLYDYERSDLVGGWIHDYVDEITGHPLRWSEGAPEPPDGESTRAARFKQAWVANMRERNILRTQTAARIYRLTGEVRYAEWAARQLDYYGAEYGQWPLRTENGRGRMFRHGLDEAVYSFALLDAARLLEQYAGEERAIQWRDRLFYPMADNLQTVGTPGSNIALWHRAAIAAIAMRYRDTEMLSHALSGAGGVLAMLTAGQTVDDVWYEGSFAYNNYVVDALSKLLVQASLEGYSGAVTPIADVVLRALLAPIDFRFDDGSLPTPGDASSGSRAIDGTVHARLYRVLPTYFGLKKAAETESWEALLDPPPQVSATAPTLPSVVSRNFPGVRMAVLREGQWQAFIHYGQVTPNHAQEEALTYELQHDGTAISRDAGTVAYASPYHTQYFSRAAANNVPLIDGLGQTLAAPGDIVESSPAEGRITVSHPKYRPDAKVVRTYRISAEGFTEQTTISLTGGGPKRLGSTFHTTCSLSPAGGLSPALDTIRPPANPTTEFWTQVSGYDAATSWSLKLSCTGGKSYLLEISGPKGQQVFIAKAPNTPLPATRNVVYYEARAASATFEARVLPLR